MSGKLAEALSDEEEVRITIFKKDGKKRTIPVWFTVEGGKLKLLPMYGLRTRWFQDVEREGSIVVKAKSREERFRPKVVRDRQTIDGIVDSFAEKYGASSRKYYATQDVALLIDL